MSVNLIKICTMASLLAYKVSSSIFFFIFNQENLIDQPEMFPTGRKDKHWNTNLILMKINLNLRKLEMGRGSYKSFGKSSPLFGSETMNSYL